MDGPRSRIPPPSCRVDRSFFRGAAVTIEFRSRASAASAGGRELLFYRRCQEGEETRSSLSRRDTTGLSPFQGYSCVAFRAGTFRSIPPLLPAATLSISRRGTLPFADPVPLFPRDFRRTRPSRPGIRVTRPEERVAEEPVNARSASAAKVAVNVACRRAFARNPRVRRVESGRLRRTKNKRRRSSKRCLRSIEDFPLQRTP